MVKCGKFEEGIWESQIFPKFCEIIKKSLIASTHNSTHRENTFEFFGADFMMDENLNVYLLGYYFN